MTNPIKQYDSQFHLHGFDYLRVFFMMMVLMGHANFFIEMAMIRQQSVGAGPNFWDYFYFEMPSGVPTFILMSMVLFVLKKPTWQRTTDRVVKLSYLYVFWVGAWFYHTRITPEMSFLGIVEFILRGGGWAFYTFATLIVLTPICWIASKLSRKGQWMGLVLAACAVFATFLYAHHDNRWLYNPYYWVPSCFGMMPFAATLLVPHLDHLSQNSTARFKWVFVLLGIGLCFAIIEWKFAAPIELIDHQRRWLPKFARYSMQFSSLSLLILSLGVKNKANQVVLFFARNSLGVYCIHPFVIGGFIKMSKHFGNHLSPAITLPFACIATAVFCSLVAEFLRKAFQQRLI